MAEVYYTAEIDYRHPKQGYNSGYYSACSLDNARAELARGILYYQTLNTEGCPTQVVRARVTTTCALCNGAGIVRKARGRGTRVCPDCKGKALPIVETWIDLPAEAIW